MDVKRAQAVLNRDVDLSRGCASGKKPESADMLLLVGETATGARREKTFTRV